MRIGKRIGSGALAAALAASLVTGLAGCNGGGSGSQTAGPAGPGYLNSDAAFPIVKEPITLKILAKGNEYDFKDVKMFQEYEKMTNIHIEWDMVPSSGASEVVNLTFASGDLPDAYLKCGLSANRQIRYGEEGQLLDLMKDGRLQTYAPHFWAYMQKYPDVKASQTFPSGAIYSIPAACEDAAARIPIKCYMNTAWLQKVGKTFPKTTEELREVLRAFKTGDPNGNGKADEIPFSVGFGNLLELCKGWFGLQNRGTHHTDIDMDEKTGKLRFIAGSNEYRQLLTYLKSLYSEKLIDQETFTLDSMDTAALVNQNKTGMYIFTNLGLVGQDIQQNWEGIEPITGPNGDSLWSGVRSHLHSTGAFVISTACRYPEAALRWVDYFYSDEGDLFYHYGKEGDTCVENEDGSYRFTDDILATITGSVTYDEVVGQYTPYGGGNNPTIMKYPYFSGAEMQPKAVAAAKKVEGHIPQEVWPFFNFTLEENLDYDVIMKDINGFVTQRSGEFIAGKVDLSDANWQTYLDQINQMNLSRAMELANQAYERAQKVMQGS